MRSSPGLNGCYFGCIWDLLYCTKSAMAISRTWHSCQSFSAHSKCQPSHSMWMCDLPMTNWVHFDTNCRSMSSTYFLSVVPTSKPINIVPIPFLQYLEWRRIPNGHRTKQYPLCISTIEESSVTSNIAMIYNVYINQLKMTHHNLSNLAIPSINDQSTNAHRRGAKALWAKDVNSFTHLQFLQLGPGHFHLSMNLIWVLLHIHSGSINQPGSLLYFFALLDCSQLGCEHSHYHTLLSTLFQILKGIILNAWQVECGATSLASFASSKPSPGHLLGLADKILQLHTMPLSGLPLSKKQQQSAQAQRVDYANQNLKILMQDLLYVLELVEACTDGDFGRVEDILGSLAMIFCGAGSNNYCSEILYFIYNLWKVWTPEFGCIHYSIVFVHHINLCCAEISCGTTCSWTSLD